MSACTKCGYPVGNHPFWHPFAPVVAEAPKPPATCKTCGGPVAAGQSHNHPPVADSAMKPAPESPYVPLDFGIGGIEALGREVAALGALLDVKRRAALRHAKELRRVFQFTLDLSGPRDVRDIRIDPNMKASAEEACSNFDAYLAAQAKAAEGGVK